MNLAIPKEPQDIKKWMQSLKANQLTEPSIDWDSFVVWTGNKLPKYLWDAWKKDLKPQGFTWQKFLRLLGYRTDIGVLWYKNSLPWGEYVKNVLDLIDGPIGQGIHKS